MKKKKLKKLKKLKKVIKCHHKMLAEILKDIPPQFWNKQK